MSLLEQRQAALARVEAARAAGDSRELGIALTALSRFVRDYGLDDGRPPFVAAAEIGAEAVEVLRAAGDGALLSAALRAAAVPFTANEQSLLNEAITVARDAESREQEAWSLFTRGTRGRDFEMVQAAHDLFVALDNGAGKAFCLRTLAINGPAPRPEKAALLEESGNLLLSAGREDDAHRSFMMAAMFGSPDISPNEQRRLLHRALDAAMEPMDRALTLRNLAWVAERGGDKAAAAGYRAAEDNLDVAAYGSRVARLQRDLEILQEETSWHPKRKQAKHQLRIKAVEEEIARLEAAEAQ